MEDERIEEQDSFEALLRSDRGYQSAFDKKVNGALQTARANWEREQAAALEGLRSQARTEAEGEAQAAYAQRLAELAQREGEFARRQRQADVADQLLSRGLPAKFAPWLTGGDEAECAARVAEFDEAFRTGLSETVTARMAGAPPTEPSPSPAFDRESLRGMSPREINAHWAEIQNTLKG